MPTQRIAVLGLVLKTLTTTVMLTKEKAVNLKRSCALLLQDPKVTNRQVTRVIGQIVARFPGVMHGPLYCGNLEGGKSQALKTNRGKFDAYMSLSKEV